MSQSLPTAPGEARVYVIASARSTPVNHWIPVVIASVALVLIMGIAVLAVFPSPRTIVIQKGHALVDYMPRGSAKDPRPRVERELEAVGIAGDAGRPIFALTNGVSRVVTPDEARAIIRAPHDGTHQTRLRVGVRDGDRFMRSAGILGRWRYQPAPH